MKSNLFLKKLVCTEERTEAGNTTGGHCSCLGLRQQVAISVKKLTRKITQYESTEISGEPEKR